jgi:hypothetical protein
MGLPLFRKMVSCASSNENKMSEPKAIELLRDVETEINISGIISNHTYSEIVKLLKTIDGK